MKYRLVTFSILAITLFGGPAVVQTQPAMDTQLETKTGEMRKSKTSVFELVIENGRVIIGNGTVLEQASVVVAGDSIYSVTQEPVEAPEARRINASGKTILPGLIDAHVHLTIPPNGRDSTALGKHLEENIPTILNGFLDHGITTVRSTGDYWPWR